MDNLTKYLCLLLINISFFSCIQKEPLNAEADILECFLPEEVLAHEPIIYNDRIIIKVKDLTDLTGLSPKFRLTEGAIINPPSGTPRDFTSPQYYTVTSEDRKWQKDYEVMIGYIEMETQYSFDNYELDNSERYYTFYEEVNGFKQYLWGSANALFALTGMGSSPEDYPTTIYDEGIAGKALKLETKSTGFFGSVAGKPIAAGNFFMGVFDASNAMRDPLRATRFGQPFNKIPTEFKGHYKYTPGKVFTDKDKKVIKDRIDSCSIYAVFYETSDTLKTLDGTNVMSHPSIYSEARIHRPMASEEFIHFSIPFIRREGKTIDRAKLKNNEYKVAIVFSSSKDGNSFEGAVGSTLIVDEVELIISDEDEGL